MSQRGMQTFSSNVIYNKMLASDTMRSSKINREQAVAQQNEFHYNSRISMFASGITELKAQRKNLRAGLERKKNEGEQTIQQIEEKRKKVAAQKQEKEKEMKANLNMDQLNNNYESNLDQSLQKIVTEYNNIVSEEQNQKWNLNCEIHLAQQEIDQIEKMIQQKRKERREFAPNQQYNSDEESVKQQYQINQDLEKIKKEEAQKKKLEEDKNNLENEKKKKEDEEKRRQEEEARELERLKRIDEEAKRLEQQQKKEKQKENLHLIPSFMKKKNEEPVENKDNNPEELPVSNQQEDGASQRSGGAKNRYSYKRQATAVSDFSKTAERNINEDIKKKKEIKEFLYHVFIILFSFFFDMIAFMTIIYPISILFALYGICVLIYKFKWENEEINTLFFYSMIIFTGSITLFVEVMFIYYIHQDTIEKFWFLDACIFMMTSLLVVSYIKCIHKNTKGLCDIFQLEHFIGQEVFNALFITSTDADNAYVFDSISTENYKKMKIEYQLIQEAQQAQDITYQYKTFSLEQDPNTFTKDGHDLIEHSLMWFTPSIGQYIILFGLITIKTLLALFYIYLNSRTFNYENSVLILISTLFYMNMTWCLSKVLSSQDLRRKSYMMDQLNTMLDFKGAMANDTFDGNILLDITCPISCETWDNTRMLIADLCSQKLKKLEFAYVCLFFYLIFVTFICVVSYGEIYSIFPQDSIYQHPLMTIQNTFDFLFLSALFLCRIYFGSNFNNKYNASEEKIDELIGITEDLIQMFDYFFCKYTQTNKKNVYDEIVKRIQYVSKHYQSKNQRFLGKYYDDKYQLQQDILNNMLCNFEKIKRQIQIDRDLKCYKFLNTFQLSFVSTLGSISIALFSILPTVLSKFTKIFEDASVS